MGSESVNLPAPFAYPAKPHCRRHGPEGYSHYRHYRNWLRDEFAFRCIYCLRRETWLTLSPDWEIDHFLPKSEHPDVERDYDNLVYACNRCNRTKAAKYLPNPEQVAYGKSLHVDANGEIHALDEDGKTLIESLGLDDPDYTRMRRRILESIAEASPGGKIRRWLLGYPDDLPDLSREPKPKSNRRLEGIADSYFERNRRNELPDYY
jgi:hypothetical protein